MPDTEPIELNPIVRWTIEQLEERGVVWAYFAKKAKVSQSTLSNMKSGHVPSVETLDRILRQLGYELRPVAIVRRHSKDE